MTIPSLTEADLLTDQIDAILPQTQCRQCTYPCCRLYAAAIVSGEADIDQCPPGGEAGVAKLAALLGRAVKPLNPVHGQPKPRAVAWIDEAVCIGCALCIKACPVDAIVGAAKLMHTVISAECTGCELCIAPCPVDCIDMRPIESTIGTWSETPRADRARGRYEFRLMRLARDEADKELAARSSATDARQATVAAAIERAKMKRAGAANQQETAKAASQPVENQSADPDHLAQ